MTFAVEGAIPFDPKGLECLHHTLLALLRESNPNAALREAIQAAVRWIAETNRNPGGSPKVCPSIKEVYALRNPMERELVYIFYLAATNDVVGVQQRCRGVLDFLLPTSNDTALHLARATHRIACERLEEHRKAWLAGVLNRAEYGSRLAEMHDPLMDLESVEKDFENEEKARAGHIENIVRCTRRIEPSEGLGGL